MESQVSTLISGRFKEFSDFDCKGGSAECIHSIQYNENEEAKISVEFINKNIVELSGDELKRILDERGISLNKKLHEEEKTLKTQARPLFKGPHKEDKNIENSHEKNS